MGQCELCTPTPSPRLVIDSSPRPVLIPMKVFATIPLPSIVVKQQEQPADNYSHHMHIPTDLIISFNEHSLPDIDVSHYTQDQSYPSTTRAIKMGNFVYIGQWRHFQPWGFGTYYYDDGSIYKGISHDLLPDLYGYKLFVDGSSYLGEYSRGMHHGQGVFKGLDGFSFSGLWLNNLPSEGKEVWPDGTVFEGSYFQGKKNGIGAIRWPNGNTYQGEFMNDFMHGFGTYWFAEGHMYEGEWRNSVMHGYGRLLIKNEGLYQGDFNQGVISGGGAYVSSVRN